MNPRRKGVFVACGVLLCFALISGRALWEGHAALSAGDKAISDGNPVEAIVQWRRAARWYVPLAPHVGAAYERLVTLAEQSKAEGQSEIALKAWRGVRNSVRATRSFYTPHQEQLEQADQKIAELMARFDTMPVSLEARRDFHYELLKRDLMPSVWWSIVALLGMALWIASGFLFATKALDESDKLRPRAAAYCGGGIAVGLLIWLTGLSLA